MGFSPAQGLGMFTALAGIISRRQFYTDAEKQQGLGGPCDGEGGEGFNAEWSQPRGTDI